MMPEPQRYSVPRAMGENRTNVSPVVAVSIEEKVSDLIRAYPHLEPYLKSHSNDPNARIRDLAITGYERDQLLYQIIAARRQQVQALGQTVPPAAPRASSFRPRFHRPRRSRAAQGWAKPPAHLSSGLAAEKWRKRLWG